MSGRHDRRVRDGHLPHAHRYAGEHEAPRVRERLRAGSLLWIINHVNFQYFSVLITIVSAAVMVAVSCATPRPAPEQIRGLTFGTTTRQQRLSSRESWSWGDVAASAFVLAAIAAAYLYFTG